MSRFRKKAAFVYKNEQNLVPGSYELENN